MIDKRFGGELTDEDILGVAESDEEEEEEEQWGLASQQDARSQHSASHSHGGHSTAGSSKSQAKAGSRSSSPGKKAGGGPGAGTGAGLPSRVAAPKVVGPLACLEILGSSAAAAAGGRCNGCWRTCAAGALSEQMHALTSTAAHASTHT
jgi:hypothetical protein